MNSTTMNAARAATFDPSEWLSRFESLGGGYTINPEGELSIGYLLRGVSDANRRNACRMVTGLTVNDKDALRAHLLGKRDGSADPDAAIIEAWTRRSAAWDHYNSLTTVDLTQDGLTPEERELWAAVDEAEEVIRATVAKTPRGVAIQLWAMLSHTTGTREDDLAAASCDLDHFERVDGSLDWSVRQVIAALRSLKAMGA